MSHTHARLTLHGRLLLVRRVRLAGRPVTHAAEAMVMSRQVRAPLDRPLRETPADRLSPA